MIEKKFLELDDLWQNKTYFKEKILNDTPVLTLYLSSQSWSKLQ